MPADVKEAVVHLGFSETRRNFNFAIVEKTSRGFNSEMAPRKTANQILLAWSAPVETSAGVDPLGLALRVGARLTSQLLHCVTSITPRARYFSFLPWCIEDYRTREAGTKKARGLLRAIELREHALVLGCILHHEGEACEGGGLTGSDEAKKWFTKGIPVRPNLNEHPFYKNPALSAYFGSLMNIGLIRPTDELVDDSDEEREITFDDIELSELGQSIAKSYGRVVQNIPAVELIASSDRIPKDELLKWGKRGGLCELRLPQASDRKLLRELFFSLGDSSEAHAFRRATFLLLLHFADEFAENGYGLNARSFNDVTYFGCLVDWDSDAPPNSVTWPAALSEIVFRWRMYHFHHYCWFALEAMFASVVSEARSADIVGVNLEKLLVTIHSRAAASEVAEILGLNASVSTARLTPRELWAMCGFENDPMSADGAVQWNRVVDARHVLSEGRLEAVLRREDFSFGASVMLEIVLLLSSLARYRRWEDSGYGHWLFGLAKSDAFLDVTTPQILRFLREEFDDFTRTPLAELAARLIRRFVIRQHEAMAFTKPPFDGSRAFFHVDQGRIFVRAEKVWQPKQDNGRLRSAVQILTDLGFLEDDKSLDGAIRRTVDGTDYLEGELAGLKPA